LCDGIKKDVKVLVWHRWRTKIKVQPAEPLQVFSAVKLNYSHLLTQHISPHHITATRKPS